MSKIDSKLEKILMGDFYPVVGRKGITPIYSIKTIDKIKHLILSEIKKVEPKIEYINDGETTSYSTNCSIDNQEKWLAGHHSPYGAWRRGKNQAIFEYHKALEELLK